MMKITKKIRKQLMQYIYDLNKCDNLHIPTKINECPEFVTSVHFEVCYNNQEGRKLYQYITTEEFKKWLGYCERTEEKYYIKFAKSKGIKAVVYGWYEILDIRDVLNVFDKNGRIHKIELDKYEFEQFLLNFLK